MQKVCDWGCAMSLAISVRAKIEKREMVKDKRETKAKLDGIKTIPMLIKEAQIVFNKFIRLRDQDKPCICCGRPLGTSDVGGAFDCGHWRSVGSASHLRFDERNAHGQTKACNRYGAGRAVDYRAGLLVRLGREAVEALESDNHVHKWTREELISIKAYYQAKTKARKASQA